MLVPYVLDDWVRTLIDRHRFGVVLDNMGAEEWQLVEETMAADASPDFVRLARRPQ